MKKKLQLNELQVQSFVTAMNLREQDTLKGGNSVKASCQCTPPEGPTFPCPTVPLLDCIL